MTSNSIIQQYAECISSGAITEPTGGTWISAICIWQGSTEPLNGTWLQRHCDNLGITQPLNGSWLIALANYYGETEPINGTWGNAILVGCGAVPTELIWDLTTTEWQLETTQWATAIVPEAPTWNQNGDDVDPDGTMTGTAGANNKVTFAVDGQNIVVYADANGDWTLDLPDLGGSASPGTNYPVSITQFDMATGLGSPSTTGSINVIVTTRTFRFELGTGWSLFWYYAGIVIQQETTPGVWTSIEYNNNPQWTVSGLPYFYKVKPNRRSSWSYPTNTIMSYGQNDFDNPTNDQNATVDREITLDGGFNYRIIGAGDALNYGRYANYTVYEGATEFLANYNTGSDTEWDADYVQQTFTL